MNRAQLDLLETLARFGEDNDARQTARPRRMLNITRDTGRLLWILVKATRAARIVEVGTSNGFSTIWLADAARTTGGRVTTLELNPDKIAQAHANLASAGLADVVDIVEGKAADSLARLPEPFGLLVADNVTSHASELGDYLARVKSHPQLFSVTVPIGNGEEIALKLGQASTR